MKLFNQLIAEFDERTEYRHDTCGVFVVIQICAAYQWNELGKSILAAFALRNDDLHFCSWCKRWYNDTGFPVEFDDVPETHGCCPMCRDKVLNKAISDALN